MALDPILAAGFKAPDFDDTNRLRDRLALKTAQSDYDQGQAKIARQNKLLDFYRTSDRNSPDFTDNLYKIDPSAAQGEEKSRSEIAKARAAALKDQEAVETEQFKRTGDQRKGLIQAISSAKDRPDLSKPMVMSIAQGLLRQGLIDQDMFDSIGGELPDDPAQLNATLGSSLQSLIDAEKQMTDATQRSEGAAGRANQLTIAQVNDARQRSEGALGRQVSMRGQDITAQGQLTTDARERAKVSQEDRKLTTAEGARVRDANDVLSLLDMFEKVDPVTGKSILNTATSSTIGNIADKTVGAFGIDTSGSKAGAKASAIEGMLISKMPKMSGPQSDKDVLMYRQMAGKLGDPTTTEGDKRAAAEVIREINARHAGSNKPAGASGSWDDGGQNAAALAWVKANPNDPRAAAIKAKLGVQ